ncbi:hypothetical protein [Peribacillus asahii]|uniref:hypothetical protein n=1 Tax=Peribacillus asahii TaxID=228899 RepID=UPI00207A7259|nr:hypothetical protein [Peribacillus asahii]USK71791.1 hypothetical protein LIS76_08560 [Peribacillus asahii]
MKIKWSSKVLASALVVSLAFSTASFANAQSSDNKKTEQTNKVQKEDKSSKKTKVGKTVEKRLTSVESSITNITKSINVYFGVTEDAIVDKKLSKKAASKKYNSYKGKLKADINKLRAIDKQLASYKKKYKGNTAEFDALAVKSKELQNLAKAEIQRVKDLAEQASTPKEENKKQTLQVIQQLNN